MPKTIAKLGYFKFIYLIKKLKEFKKQKKKVFVFTPTIEKCELVFRILSVFVGGGSYVHSKCSNRTEIIKNFKEGDGAYLVTTAVLERGVTFKNLQVIIFDADHKLYDSQALIQIAGRVGRKIDAPEGEVIFLVNKPTLATNEAIRTIESKNASLQGVF